jgi:hypothetical protein
VADAAGHEVGAPGAARRGHEDERRGHVARRRGRDAGRVGGGADEHVVAVEHEPPARLERRLGRHERRAGGLVVREREAGLAGAQAGQGARAVGAHVAHGDAVAARHGQQHRAHVAGLRERRRALDGDAHGRAAGARGGRQEGRGEQTGEQASHHATVGKGAAPVKPERPRRRPGARVII